MEIKAAKWIKSTNINKVVADSPHRLPDFKQSCAAVLTNHTSSIHQIKTLSGRDYLHCWFYRETFYVQTNTKLQEIDAKAYFLTVTVQLIVKNKDTFDLNGF